MAPSTPLGCVLQRRSTRTALLTNDEGDGAIKSPQQHFPRRWPGVGSSFQCKVPASTSRTMYTTDRAAPERMSVEFPHCTRMEVETTTMDASMKEETRGIAWMTTACSTGYETTMLGVRPSLPSESLGDATVHSSKVYSKTIEEDAPSPSAAASSAAKEWTERLRAWHTQYLRRDEGVSKATEELPTQRKTNSRYKKRPLSAISKADPVALPLERTGPLAFLTAKKRPSATGASHCSSPKWVDGLLSGISSSSSACEEEQYAAECDPQALLTCLAQWTRNSARRAIRRRTRMEHAGITSEPKALDATTPSITVNETLSEDAWRDRITRDFVLTMAGDYRDVPEQSAPWISPAALEDTDLKETWRAVLCCAELMSQQSRPPRPAPLYMSEVWHFLFHASQLPACCPDDIWTAAEQERLAKVMTELVDAYAAVRLSYARLLDLWGEIGVDPDTILKEIDASSAHWIQIDCLSEMKRQVNVVVNWQKNVDKVCGACNTTDDDHRRDDLVVLEELLNEGRGHGIRSKGLVALEQKVERAYQLQERILLWKKSSANAECRETMKFTAALVRDVHRLKIRFPVVNEMLLCQQDAESWVERANIAIRSRISLDEIKALIDRGLEMPIDLSEYMEKLQSRVASATEWLESFIEVIQYPSSVDDSVDYCELIRRIRFELEENGGRHHILHDLAMEGSRIPVEINIVKVLHVELEARAWVLKTKKWLPGYDGNDESNRRGKLDDLRDHVVKAKAMRSRMDFTSLKVHEWTLEGETELSGIVDAADEWMESYQPIIDGSAEDAISIEQVGKIVERGNAIYVNLGSEATKFARFLVQAESWYKENYSLFVRCRLREGSMLDHDSSSVNLNELKDAIAVAESDFPVLLSEASELQTIVDKVEDWMFRVSLLRMKRRLKKTAQVFTLEAIVSLIDEAKSLPVNTEMDVTLLRQKFQAIQEWHLLSIEKLEDICSGFRLFREGLNKTFGPSNDYKPVQYECGDGMDEATPIDFIEVANDLEAIDSMDSDGSSDESSASLETGTTSQAVLRNHEDLKILRTAGCSDCDIYALIKSFSSSSKISPCIVTPETEVANLLKTVMRWFLRSLTYLENQHVIFDKRCFASFDRFLLEGKELLDDARRSDLDSHYCNDSNVLNRLFEEWMMILTDQLERLTILVSCRDKYLSWSKKVEQHLNSEERRPTLDKVNELADLSKEFPSSCDLVRKVKVLSVRCNEWVRSVRVAIAGPERISFSRAKSLFDEGDELGFTCEEIKSLRNGLKAARSWATRMKRSKSREDEWDHGDAQALIDEHDTLMIDMAEEINILRGALKRYCICRRTMEGFMIACDECNEWFHGSCVGIAKKRAVDRVAKFICIRCSITKTYKSSASLCVNVIRKWLSPKEMKKVRQAESQKQKRKIRKENKDMEAAHAEIVVLRQLLDSCSFPCKDGSVIPHCENASSSGSLDDCNSPSDFVASNDVTTQNLPGERMPTLSFSVVSESENDVAGATCTCASVEDDADVSPDDSGVIEISHNKTTDCEPEDVLQKEVGIGKTSEETVNFMNDCAAVEISSESVQATECTNKDESASIDPTDGAVLSKDELLSKIHQLEVALDGSRRRLHECEELTKLQNAIDKEEMKMAIQLRSWVLRVRSLVLVPSTAERAMSSKPQLGVLSDCMVQVANYAERLGIQDASDVKTVLNSFRCMSWCLHALSVFSRQPKANEIDLLIEQSSSIDFPDEKAVRVIKALAHRVAALEVKVHRVLTPSPGATVPFHLESLKSLVSIADDIPVCIPVEQRLANVIEDKGSRHCLCGGPSDGRFMLSCDQCDRWFHGHCVAVNRNAAEIDESEWKCPLCCGQSIESLDLDLVHFHEKFDVVDEDDGSVDNTDEVDPAGPSKAPDPAKLWPPFGLFGSPEATLVLGGEVCAIPDSVDMTLNSGVPCASAADKMVPALTSSGCSLLEAAAYVSSNVEVTSKASPSVLHAVPPVDAVSALVCAPLECLTEPQASSEDASNTTVPSPSLPVAMEFETCEESSASPHINSIGVEPMECVDDTPQISAVVSDSVVFGVGFGSLSA